MSIYDNLADSGFLDKDQFKQQFEKISHPYDDSLDGSNKFNEYTDSARVNQEEDNFYSGMNDQFQMKDFAPDSTPIYNNQFQYNYDQPSDNESRLNYLLQFSSNIKNNKDSNIMPNGEDLNLKQELFKQNLQTNYETNYSKRTVQLEDDEIVHPYPNQQTGRFPSQMDAYSQPERQDYNIEQFRNNNDQLQQLLMQLQVPQRAQQQKEQQLPPQFPRTHNAHIQRQQSELIQHQQFFFQNQNQGPTYERLNKDNSILEIAKMQNSGHNSNSDNFNNHSMIGENQYFQNQHIPSISRDYSPQQKYHPQPMGNNMDYFQNNQMMVGNSLASYQKFIPPYPSNMHTREVSYIDKENIDQNLFQLREPRMADQNLITKQMDIRQIPEKPMSQQDKRVMQQPQQQQTTFYSRQLTDQEIKKKEIMERFDEIPIKILNKDPGYQKQLGEDEQAFEETEGRRQTLMQRIESLKWKVRQRAYNKITELFYDEYAKTMIDQNIQIKPIPSLKKQDTENDEDDFEEEEEDDTQINAFEKYGPILQKIICDSNLAAQYDALVCLKAYVDYAPDIKWLVFLVSDILLEKIQHNKPNFRSKTIEILEIFIKKDKTQSIIPELLKRFKNKNIKIACFSMEVIMEALRIKPSIINDESTLRQIFKGTQDQVKHSNKEVRDSSIQIIKELYVLCNDDVASFLKNFKDLRPIQEKEIKDILNDLEKPNKYSKITLFPQKAQTYTDGFSPKKNQGKADNLYDDQESDNDQNKEPFESDLLLLVPQNFSDIPYITQINVKKKGLETFNQALEKIINKKLQNQVQVKDYTTIFNVVTHMLEDSNALVFMEAIKTVEYLCIILGKNIKAQKIRQFIGLLADKYKETKTAPVQAVNKALSVIMKKQSIPTASLIDYMVNQLAHNNKNPRVKQLLLEKVDSTLQEEKMGHKEEEMIQIFKSVKDKIIGFIQKDTNAGVRDAAVSLLTTFKSQLPQSQVVTETINNLPKYRITEINKQAIERQNSFKNQEPENNEPLNQNNQGPPKSAKQKDILPTKQICSSIDDFTYEGRNISDKYQIHLGQIILSIKDLLRTNLNTIKLQSLQAKWDECIENLGEFGIKEAKPVIISCIHWLLSLNKIEFKDHPQILEALLVLAKQIFCIERSVEKDNSNGQSKELDQAIEIVLISSQLLYNKKQAEALLNVLLSASGHASEFNDSLQRVLMKMNKQQIDQIAVLNFTFKWLSQKLDQLLLKGMVFSELEDLRGIGIQFLNDQNDQQINNEIINIMKAFKDSLIEKKKNMEYCEESSIEHDNEEADQDEEYKESVSNIVGNIKKSEKNESNNFQISEIEHQKPKQQQVIKSLGEQIAEAIDIDFEKGLMMIRNIAQDPSQFTFPSKELVFMKILKIVTNLCKNPQQQYQQAYALKALMWMREELFGLEDSYKFSSHVMMAYANAENEEKDSSVELYLLNHWVKELSLRDLIASVQIASTQNEKYFASLMKWLNFNRLQGNTEEKWQIDDFRKVALLLARNCKDETIKEFFIYSCDKFGKQKIQQFMEMQLIHNMNEYNLFMNWFSQQFRVQTQEINTTMEKLTLPQIIVEKEDQNSGIKQKKQKFEDLELNNVLKYNQNDESALASTRSKGNMHSKLYQQMREQRKNIQRKNNDDEGANKYDEIINRLEAQINNPQKLVTEESKIETQDQEKHFNFYKSNNSNYYHSEKSTRYNQVKTEEDEEELSGTQQMVAIEENKFQKEYENYQQESKFEKKEELMIQETQNKLQESFRKENRYKEDLQKLEQEKRRIEMEREYLMQEKNKESKEWQNKYDHMRLEHEEVIKNLKEANKCYLTQVGENEELREQLKMMQDQHKMMMKKFQEFEEKLIAQNEAKEKEMSKALSKNSNIQVVTEEKLALIKDTFNGQLMNYSDEAAIGIKKIQELLLNLDEKKKIDEDICQPLFFYYQQIKQQDQKLKLVKSLLLSLDNEDVLFALPISNYKSTLDFTLRVFANEKARLESKSIGVSQSFQKGNMEQNEITIETQKIVSKLLNSKEFTTSLVTLFSILKNAMPEDLSIDMNEEQKQYLRVIMRCVSRITKALHSENPDLIRGFDVLIEMQKIFLKNPPEKLREDLPCLQDFDQIYRVLKEVSDKLMELQPEKVIVFLDFVKDQPQNAFLKYMSQIMGSKKPQVEDDDEELYDEGY